MSRVVTKAGAALGAGNMDTTNKFAWAANAGWINLAHSNGGVTATRGPNGCLTGEAWGDNVGWINFNPGNG